MLITPGSQRVNKGFKKLILILAVYLVKPFCSFHIREENLQENINMTKSNTGIFSAAIQQVFIFLHITKEVLFIHQDINFFNHFIALFINMQTVQFKAHHAKFILCCRQSCC